MSRPLTQSDLIFPTQSLSLSSTLSSLKRSALSIHNRLSSIQFDANFVAKVSVAFGLPLVANERCGSWYISPDKKAESVYFKSTDGHTNEWKFSVRRLNLQLLDLIGKAGGCVIVDSTRRGKSMPDALSKTIPIWCCVMNHSLFSELGEHELHTAPQAVSESEHAQIEKMMDGFVREFLEICRPDVELLRNKIQKPLRPIWITQNSSIPETPPSFPDFYPVVLCTASRRVTGAEGSEGGYIQGAADDHEAWSQGLTSTLFWSHKHELLNTNEEDLPDLIKRLVEEETTSDAVPILVKPTSNLYVSTIQNLKTSTYDVVISCGAKSLPESHSKSNTRYLHLQCQAGKLGSRDLRNQLKQLFILETWLPSGPTDKKILICDHSGKDLAVGTALAILCMYADANGVLACRPHEGAKIDKKIIKQRLSWLTTTHPTLNPPRATLQSVNAFLMPNPSAITSNRNLPEDSNADAHSFPVPHPPSTTLPQLSTLLPTASTIFTALQSHGTWTFTRTLTSNLPTHPSGTVTGTATFTPLPSSRPSLLYTEEGEFITDTGLRFTARRKYVYILRGELNEEAKRMFKGEYVAVHFHEAEEVDGVGGLFVTMGNMERKEGGVVSVPNREQHLCAEDLYTARWEFPVFSDEKKMKWWSVRYDVKGPRKEYVSETVYT
ncbi:tRNA A64-2'-O-ribosylphosphate transferase [Didymosphaeria variabile]|uniref:tRNA A64-2'-O-ribosylphosphate transferase n=1 Tax=Didymosphaeria variabile TaxID=1932322 RepID=A0A9W8XKR4_9PLEO|nr:tRNA A64-2'-O-ribosylphosphate transferase [Didymosphaeria variabile]KAJ4353695.1 tRNA A64-2'-O-ribosylphosphate transferase [Didymosphaeria variabile]